MERERFHHTHPHLKVQNSATGWDKLRETSLVMTIDYEEFHSKIRDLTTPESVVREKRDVYDMKKKKRYARKTKGGEA